jgi:hypothetical protein
VRLLLSRAREACSKIERRLRSWASLPAGTRARVDSQPGVWTVGQFYPGSDCYRLVSGSGSCYANRGDLKVVEHVPRRPRAVPRKRRR